MARIAGVDLPQNKQVWIGLTYIYGIGRSRSQDILDARQSHKVGFLPTVEYLAIGTELHHVDVLYGIGVSLGLTLLWVMETVRDAFFRTLDRLNIKPSHRGSVSAFPPGQPRKRPQAPSSS